MIFPWQKQQWQQLWNAKEENRLPHALLFMGVAGLGKNQFAETFAAAILCKNHGCEECHSCKLIANHTHPNVLWIKPEKAGQAIKVDQIREVSDFAQQSAFNDGYKVIIISPANAMNISAANALLKTLEEPSSHTILILISDQSSRLPATILSRCQRIIFNAPTKDVALQWLGLHAEKATDLSLLLKLTNQAPLAAKELQQSEEFSLRKNLFESLYKLKTWMPASAGMTDVADPLKVVSEMQELDSTLFVNWCLVWMIDLIKLQLGMNGADLMNEDYSMQLQALAAHTKLSSNVKLMNDLQQLRAQMSVGINLNKQLMMESVLVRWV